MFTIIPTKPLAEAKSRLASILCPTHRYQLSQYLLQHTIHVSQQVSEVVVISRDTQVRRLAKQLGAWALVEAVPDLNQAIRQAMAWVSQQSGQAVLILPSDLPLLQLATLQNIIQLGQRAPTVVIAPCHRHEGTNGLFMHPIGLIETAFGVDSFAKHQAASHAIGLEPHIYHAPDIAFDLDWPSDWAMLNSVQLVSVQPVS